MADLKIESTVNQRISSIVQQFAGGNKSAFARAIGMSSQGLGEILGSRQSTPSFTMLQNIIKSYPQLRIEWIVMGEGSMLKSASGPVANMSALQEIQKSITQAQQEYKARYNELRDALQTQSNLRSAIIAFEDEFKHLVDEKKPALYAELSATYDMTEKYLGDYTRVLRANANDSRLKLADLHSQLATRMAEGNFDINKLE